MGTNWMIFLPFMHFICILVFVCMAVYVLFKNPKSLLNITFSILMFCFSIWNFSDIFAHNPRITISEGYAIFLQNISSFGWISFASVLLCFSLAFSKKQKILEKKFILFIITILPLFFMYNQWTNSLLSSPIKQPYGWSYTWVNQKLSYLFYAYYIVFTFLSLFFIYQYGRKTNKLIEKKQSKTIVFAITISLIGGSIFDVLLPLLNINNIPAIGDIFVLFFAVGIGYTILKYKFLTITPATAAENIISTMEEFLILLNNEGSVLSVNRATLDSLGFKPRELKGKSIRILVKDKDPKSSMLEKVIRGETIRNIEGSFQKKNGEEIPVLFSSSPLKKEEGDIAGTVFIAREITELKLFEQELFNQNKRVFLLAQATAEFNSSENIEEICNIIIAFSIKMGYEHSALFERQGNSLKIKKLGAVPLELIKEIPGIGEKVLNEWMVDINSQNNILARSYRENKVIHTKDIRDFFRDTFVEQISDVVKTNLGPLNAGSTTVLPISDYGVLTLSGQTEKSDSEHIEWIQSIIAQASTAIDREKAKKEKEETYKQLINAEKMAGVGTLAAGVAHEFNNLLQIMKSNVEFANRSGETEDFKDSNNTIISTINRAAKIVIDLLSYSRRTSKGAKPDLIRECLDNVLSLTEFQLNKLNIKIIKNYGKIKPAVFDRAEMQQVFLNLIVNARDAMSETGGTIEINISEKDNRVFTEISDTGVGIKKENLSKIFEPFHTTKGALGSSKISGTGLGLFVSYNIVKKYGGDISVFSPRKDGKPGTTFIISLLAAKAIDITEKKIKPRNFQNLKPLRILIIDDETEIGTVLKRMLSDAGHLVEFVNNGEKGIVLALEKTFDVVFLDCVMPGISGEEVLKEIKKVKPGLKIIMVTGKLFDENTPGASGFIRKPFDFTEINTILASIID